MSANDRIPVERLDALADHCIAARKIIEGQDAPMMRNLIDMLLLEVGVALAASLEPVEERQPRTACG